jgi:RNA-directed DNA polymerase
MLWRWARWNHPDKSRGWIKRRYHSADAHGAFSVWIHNRDGKRRALSVYSMARTVIERHIKVRGEANPYQPEHVEYFEKRRCFVWRTSPVGKLRALKAGRDKIATQDAVITKNSDWRITSAEADLRKA